MNPETRVQHALDDVEVSIWLSLRVGAAVTAQTTRGTSIKSEVGGVRR